jgi:hypothetical protein
MAVSKAQMRSLQRRKSSDIDRLAQQYQKDITALAGEYEQSFTGFQTEREKQMEPYNLAAEKYSTEVLPNYERDLKDFQKKLSDYEKLLVETEKNPYEDKKIQGMYRGSFQKKASSADPYEWGYVIDDKFYGFKNLPKGYVEEREGGNFALKQKSVPKFTEKAPEAPTAPEMPEFAEFDETSFQTRRGELETGFKREVGERKAARLSAVSRKTARPLLQGA